MVAAALSNLKPVTLELGGKSPLIIMDDADNEEAVNLAHTAIFFSSGQVCCAGSRIYVQEGIHDKFVKRVVERAKKQVVGDPFNPEVDHGPQASYLINQAQETYEWLSRKRCRYIKEYY